MAAVFNIPANYSFLDCLAQGTIQQFGDHEESLSRLLILLPSRRACRELQKIFLKHSQGKEAIILPRIIPIGDIEDETNGYIDAGDDLLYEGIDLPSPLSTLEQRILLTKLIIDNIDRQNLTDDANLPDLALELSYLLGELQREQADIKKLVTLSPDDPNLSLYWQQIMQFLHLLIDKWPTILAHNHVEDPISYRNLLLNRIADKWKNLPPSYPVIAAGSTGSNRATLQLLSTIASMQNGSIILPGLDSYIDDQTWEAVNELHPQHNLRNLLTHINTPRQQVAVWHGCEEQFLQANHKRLALVSEIMRPASTCDQWQYLSSKDLDSAAIDGMQICVCDNQQQEAKVISLLLRETLEHPGKTTALVTHDQSLIARVKSLLPKWNITIDDSSGLNLLDTQPIIYMRLILEMLLHDFNAVDMLAVLKHDLTSCGYEKADFTNLINTLETKILRGVRITNGLQGIIETLSVYNYPQITELLHKFANYSQKLQQLLSNTTASFTALLEAHINLAEILAGASNQQHDHILWQGEDGEAAAEILSQIHASSHKLGNIHPKSYSYLLQALLIGNKYYPANKTVHPRLIILSPIEARFQQYDRVIMAGINEGSWPKIHKASPWLTRHMRNELVLPSPEHTIGQAAHDFANLLCAKEVIITRSIREQGTEAIPSRFLARLETVAKKLSLLDHMQNPSWALLANRLALPTARPSPLSPPRPTPPVQMRPSQLSVTQIEKLMCDPYSIYISHILKLKPLEPLDADPGAAEFGTFIHQALDYLSLMELTPDIEQICNQLISCGKRVVAEMGIRPAIYNLWWPRFKRIARWFASHEANTLLKQEIDIFAETSGRMLMHIDNNSAPFTLSAKADRIEINKENNNINIIDYKTGTIPTTQSIKSGTAPQMTLEGLIARNKGFACQFSHKEYKIASLAYIRLTGGEKPGELQEIKDINILIDQAESGIKHLISTFLKQETPYLACPFPERSPRYNHYEHLERMQEWNY